MTPTYLPILALGLLWPAAAQADARGWDRASGIARNALVGAALGIPAVQGDWRGDLQAAGSMAVAGGTTFVLKELVHERRPDGSDDRGFPSGHTSISFAAAASLEKRYGWRAGLPALLVASFVGVARVRADKHYVHDVLAGAAIGTAGGFLLTARHDDAVRLTPWSAHRGGGLALAMRF
ncbi:phosphatase PAP2 family protein [Sphingomonas sp. A2-49]|uniref:phosphatase PAP2 family protein n=1 Tax=Sphingomonas sp. A2-49 TaxID=1391375 RepID=UPI0021D3B4C8|nr:phosphatase PAP2 family protein [Sphingomonas sp. A2-49]MCU6454142.1 phosphatase PAP2 family protein [Sphingomonas sp. A2-49]